MLHAVEHANQLVLLAGLVGAGSVVLSRLARAMRVPAPALFLAAGVAATSLSDSIDRLGASTLVLLGTFLLVPILFDGGFAGGWQRARSVIAPVLTLGILGTLLTWVLLAVACHWLVGLPVHAAVLVGIALAPTDPAAVFSVLGDADIEGRTGIVLEGESGWNDPVGISLMLGAIAWLADGSGAASVAGDFALQLVVGAAVGVVAASGIARVLAIAAPAGTALRVLAVATCMLLVFGMASLLHGSGFLAVFVAGLVLGDAAMPDRRTIAMILSAGSGLAEFAMFLALGLSLPLSVLDARTVGEGLAVFALLTLVVRPLVTVGLLAPWSGLTRREHAFVAWGGLKGAVPILLAALPVAARLDGAQRVFEVVFVAVAASVLVQGTTLPPLARRLGLVTRPEPPAA